MALLLIENFPTPKPGVRTPFPTVVRKAKALGITIKRPSKFMRDKDGYGYTCDFCGFREEEGDEGVSNGALNRLFRDALPHPEIPGYVIAKPACSRCAELHRAANPRIGRNQFGDRKGYEDYDYRFQSCGFLLCKEQLPEHGLLSASQKYPCVCMQCEKQQNHCANDTSSVKVVGT